MIFNSNPANLNALIAERAIRRPGTSPASRPRRSASSTRTSTPATGASTSPRPTWAVWFGDNWRVNDQLTLNYGVRWDVDRGVASPPDVITNTIPINNGTRRQRHSPAWPARLRLQGQHPRLEQHRAARRLHLQRRRQERFRHPRRHRPLLRDPGSNITFSPQIYSQMVTATFLPTASGRCADARFHHQSGLRRHDLRAGEGCRAGAVAAHHRPDFKNRTPGRAASASRSSSTR